MARLLPISFSSVPKGVVYVTAPFSLFFAVNKIILYVHAFAATCVKITIDIGIVIGYTLSENSIFR